MDARVFDAYLEHARVGMDEEAEKAASLRYYVDSTDRADLYLSPEDTLAYIQAVHKSSTSLNSAKVDQLLLGTTCVEHDRSFFGGKQYANAGEVLAFRERHGGEQTWAPGTSEIWTDYNIVRTVVRRLGLTENDRFYDLGSGYGRLPLYAGIVTAAQCTGIELVSERAKLTKDRTALLGLENVETRAGNIRGHDFSDGTAFYMYQPFHMDTYATVADRLAEVAEDHPIRIALRINSPHIKDNDRFVHVGTDSIETGVPGMAKVYYYQSV